MINNQKNKIEIVFVLTYGKSLHDWDKSGILDREILFINRLVKNNVIVNLITYGTEKDLSYQDKIPDVKIFPLFSSNNLTQNKILKFYYSLKSLSQNKIVFKHSTIIRTNQMWGSWVAIINKILYKKLIIVRCGYELYANSKEANIKIHRLIFLYLLSFFAYHVADKIILTSNSMKKYVQDIFFVSSNKIEIIQNFVDTSCFDIHESLDEVSNRVLYIGRLSREKNIDLLLRSCKQVSIGITIVGSGPQQKSLMDLANQLKLEAKFTGVVPNNQIPKLINQHRIFALVSNYEGNPKSLIEAMSCGRAVIGSNVRGINDLINHNSNGIICDLDIDSLNEAIKTYKGDVKFASNCGVKARKTILRNNNLRNMVESEIKLYRRIMV